MNNFEDFNTKNENEMDKIQREIDNILNPETREATSPETTQAAASETIETTTPETIEAATPDMAIQPAPPFYNETIKTVKKEPKFSNKFVALVVGVGAVCALAAIFFIGPRMQLKNGEAITNKAEIVEPKVDTGESAASAAAGFKFNDAEEAVSSQAFDSKSFSKQFVAIIKRANPSVVSITTSEEVAQGYGNFFSNDPFRDFQEGTRPDEKTNENGTIERETGSGSGIIFHQDETKVYVATNAHVIRGASKVSISVNGSKAVSARLVGADQNADLAVISVLKTDLRKVNIEAVTVAKFGDSSKLEVGEFVIAIGNAFGQGNSSTIGIVSTEEKEISVNDESAPLNVIQTSATINFGNSGGPLINLDGEIIGVNTAKLSPEYGAEGMGYSIPVNRAKPILEDLMQRKTRPYLGISGVTITKEISSMYKLPKMGVFVDDIVPGSAADKAGLIRSDIITSIDGKPVFTIEELAETVKSHKINDVVEISYLRDGTKPMTVKATLSVYGDTEF